MGITLAVVSREGGGDDIYSMPILRDIYLYIRMLFALHSA